MEQSWITTTIDRMSEARRWFLFDAWVALTVNEIPGDYVEFGSWGADSLASAHAALEQIGRPRHLWAFDEFCAVHPEWRFLRYKDIHYAGVSFVVERADLLRTR